MNDEPQTMMLNEIPTAEQMDRFKEFYEAHCRVRLLENIRQGAKRIVIAFEQLAKFDPDLANVLLEDPENTLRVASAAVEQLEGVKDFHVRFADLPLSQQLSIRNVRAEHLGKFLQITGVVRQKTDVRPQVTTARFECPSCGNIISVLQVDTKFREPNGCGQCGRKGRFRLLNKELVDAQKIVLEEASDNLDGGEQPKRINVFLYRDLVAPMTDKQTNPGSKVTLTGYLKEVPVLLSTGGQSTRYDLVLETNFIEPKEEDYSQINITPEEEEEIQNLSRDPEVFTKLCESLAPSIYGHDRIKEAIVLQLLGGVKKERSDGNKSRGDMHVLLVGDPGAGKCVAGSTRITLADGTITSIQELYDSTESAEQDGWKLPAPGLQVPALGLKGQTRIRDVTRLYRRKTNKMLRIVTASGSILEMTKEHPLFTTHNGYIVQVPAELVEPGMVLATPRKIRTNTKAQTLSINKKLIQLNSDIAYFFGLLAGDGHLSTLRNEISFTNTNTKILDHYASTWKKIFGETLTLHSRDSQTKRFVSNNARIHHFFMKEVPELVATSQNKAIPKKILQSNNDVVESFIAGVFDTDGHYNAKKHEIEITLKSKEFIEDLKTILRRFSIVSRIKPVKKCATNTVNKTKRTYWRLVIRGKETTQFFSSIHCKSGKQPDKQERIYNPNIDTTPHLQSLLRLLRTDHGLRQKDFGIPRSTYMHYERGDRNPSRENLQKIADKYADSSHIMSDLLFQIAYSDVFWDPIVTITEYSTNQYVYDLEVDEVHNFVANTCIIHNSQLLKRSQVVAPKSRFVSGKGASGAGLTASVVKDEFMRGWALEAGALVLANKGFVMIDELDKMSTEDRSAFHEALEQQQVTISKANIQATLRCETVVLAAANPKFGRFDPYELLAKQIELPSTLINRFDLIFPVRDLPSVEKDGKMADFILRLHQTGDISEVPVSTEVLTKYISYARSNINPQLTDGALKEIRKFYVEMRNSGSGEEGISAIPISARQLEALVRLTEASARTRLSKEANKDDAKRAIDLVMYCLQQLGVDPDTGKMDIDRLTTGVTASTRNHVHMIKQIIRELAELTGESLVAEEEILAKAAEKNMDEIKAEEILERLNRMGDIFRPKPGYYSMMK